MPTEQEEDEWRAVVGPHVRPPSLAPMRAEVRGALREAAGAIAEVSRALAPASQLLEQAIRVVLARGYSTRDCQVVTEGPLFPDPGRPTRHTLLVRREPCFEVEVTQTVVIGDHSYVNITTTPKLIGWPPSLVG